MFIKAPKRTEKNVRFFFTLPESEASRLEEYAAYVREETGETQSVKDILPLMVAGVLDADRGFARWQKDKAKKPESQKPEPAVSSPAGNPWGQGITE